MGARIRGKQPGSKHVLGKLTALKVERLKTPGCYSDGGGLWLQIGPSGTKSWLFRYGAEKAVSKKSGKSYRRVREMGLGPLHSVSLAKARDAAAECRAQLKEGKSPIEERNAQRTADALERANSKTFKDCAEAFIKSHEAGWRNSKHAAQWESTLRDYAYYRPEDCDKPLEDRRTLLRDIPAAKVDTGLVMQSLEPIWNQKPETASRLRGRIEKVLDWARVRGFRVGENPARWRGHLETLLPKRSKVAKVKHHPSLPYSEAGAFVKALRQQEGQAAKALELIILTATRTSEAIGATWQEIDLKGATWTIPGERMKAGKTHKVPLSSRAVEILKSLKPKKAEGFVFANRDGKPLSNMACLALLERMERTDITVHGFRSTFRDWAAEQTTFPSFVAEAALAHAIGDKVEAAYFRSDVFERRRLLMQQWADYLNRQKAGAEVIPLKRPA